MRAIDAARRHPGVLLLGLALIAAAAIYAPALGRGLVSYDDPWLYRDNFVVAHPSADALRAIFLDLDPRSPARYALGAEYLPVRDLSVMLDFALWGDAWGGFHLTNLVLYLAAIALVFAMLDGFGVDRTIAGLAVLIWAIHPSHAESVAWLSERKGLLGAGFAAAAGLGFARFRAGRGAGWLAGAALATVCAVWSKAPAAFAIAGLGALELALPARRRSRRRSALGLGAIAAIGAAAFAPVLITASRTGVVAAGHGDRLATALGVHGFYLELGAMVRPNALAYPAPGGAELAIGAIALIAILGVALVPARGRWRPPGELRAAAGLWLLGWLPASHLALALQNRVADRYALWPTLGLALAVAIGIVHLPTPRARIALAIGIGLAELARSLDAQASWASSAGLWERAVASDPADSTAWSMYAEAVASSGDLDRAEAVVAEGLQRAPSARLELRQALLRIQRGRSAEALPLLERAARGGEPRAMEDLALQLLDAGRVDEAQTWAARAAAAAPFSASAQRAQGKVALAAGHGAESLAAFTAAYRLEPRKLSNRYNLGLALSALHRPAEARPHLEACLADAELHDRAAAALSRL